MIGDEIRKAIELMKSGNHEDAINTEISGGNQKNKREKVDALFKKKKKGKEDLTDLGIVGGLTFGDLIYDVSSIHPEVISAVDFASNESIEKWFEFSSHASKTVEGTAAQIEGRLLRFRGYVGEEIVASSLRKEGYEVSFPENPNQIGYDLVVDGQPFQVKCTNELDLISKHFEKYPDVPVIANSELAVDIDKLPEEFREKVFFQEGFSLDITDETTRDSFDAGDEVGDFEIPWISLAIACARTFMKYRAGDITTLNAAVHVAVESVGRTCGGFIGVPAGELLGLLLFGPAGAYVGGGVGAVLGMSQGRKVLDLATLAWTSTERKNLKMALEEILGQAKKRLSKKTEEFENRALRLRKILKSSKSSEALCALFEKKLDAETRNHEQANNELVHYTKNIEEMGSNPSEWVVTAINLVLYRAKIHPASIQSELTKVLRCVEQWQKKLKNPLPDFTQLF